MNFKNELNAFVYYANFILGIYLIHDNVYFSPIMWQDILNCPTHLTFAPLQFLAFAICSVIVVFVVCALIDLLRQAIFKGIEKIYTTIKSKNKEEQAEINDEII